MQPAHGISAGTATIDDVTLEDVQCAAGDRWVITRTTGGYKAVIREPEGAPLPRYRRTAAELPERIGHVECRL